MGKESKTLMPFNSNHMGSCNRDAGRQPYRCRKKKGHGGQAVRLKDGENDWILSHSLLNLTPSQGDTTDHILFVPSPFSHESLLDSIDPLP